VLAVMFFDADQRQSLQPLRIHVTSTREVPGLSLFAFDVKPVEQNTRHSLCFFLLSHDGAVFPDCQLRFGLFMPELIIG
jgi:hypothetical protein